MKRDQAIKLAIEALGKERQKLAFDANMFLSTRAQSAQSAHDRYAELSEAIKTLELILAQKPLF
jgi:hypothetical protein